MHLWCAGLAFNMMLAKHIYSLWKRLEPSAVPEKSPIRIPGLSPLGVMILAKTTPSVFRSADHAWGSNVVRPVLFFIFANYKVLRSVIILNAVNVVNFFVRLKVSSDCLLRNDPVLHYSSARLSAVWMPSGEHGNIPICALGSSVFIARSFCRISPPKSILAFLAPAVCFWRVALKNLLSTIHTLGKFTPMSNALASYWVMFHVIGRKDSHAV